jgi:ferredoxin-NADP reductase
VLVIQIAGGLLIGLLVCQLGLWLLSSLQRTAYEQQQQRLSLQLLRQQVETAAQLRREKEQERQVWEGYRKFVVQRKVKEAPDVASFYLTPLDRKPLPLFQPGQFLTFQLKVPGQAKPVIRCYSLSDRPQADCYRVTIKKVAPPGDKPDCPPGLASNFFHEQVKEGDILDVKAPNGPFVLASTQATPIVLIAGGIGLTPMLCMANALESPPSSRETWLFYGVRNSREHIMKEHLRRLAQERDTFHLRVCYSNPAGEDVKGRDYDFGQRVSVALLKTELPSNNYEFYVCGPPGMMATIVGDLKAWGVPPTAINTEAFGPASVPRAGAAPVAAPPAPAGAAGTSKVVFAKAGQTIPWEAPTGNLLDLALAHGIDIPFGCRVGNCGTCETALKAGQVRYLHEPSWHPQPGTCLVCVSQPAGDVELDA